MVVNNLYCSKSLQFYRGGGGNSSSSSGAVAVAVAVDVDVVTAAWR